MLQITFYPDTPADEPRTQQTVVAESLMYINLTKNLVFLVIGGVMNGGVIKASNIVRIQTAPRRRKEEKQ